MQPKAYIRLPKVGQPTIVYHKSDNPDILFESLYSEKDVRLLIANVLKDPASVPDFNILPDAAQEALDIRLQEIRRQAEAAFCKQYEEELARRSKAALITKVEAVLKDRKKALSAAHDEFKSLEKKIHKVNREKLRLTKTQQQSSEVAAILRARNIVAKQPPGILITPEIRKLAAMDV